MEYSPSDVWEGVWAAAARVGGQEERDKVELINARLPDLAGEIGAALEAEPEAKWHAAGVSFAAEVLATAMLIRVVRKEEQDVLKDRKLPPWLIFAINRWFED